MTSVLVALTASAATPALASAARPVEAAPLDRITVKKRVVDTVLKARPPVARAATQRTAVFSDPHGHRINISTGIDGLDLRPYAEILAGTLHDQEIEDLSVEVLPRSAIGAACEDPEAEACYEAEDAATSWEGRMWIPAEHPDLAHIIVHEYGHHVDNQLLNLGRLDPSCEYDSDGSRNWFFERDLDDEIVAAGFRCAGGAWEEQLGELYAEDYVAANGIDGWELPTAPPPTEFHKDVLRDDFAYPFEPRTIRKTRSLRPRRGRMYRFRATDWTFATLRLRGPRRTDFDLYVYQKGRTRPLRRSIRRGSRERLEMELAPGAYRVEMYPYRGRGRARLRIDLD